ncbi:MAG TPA: DUF3131 domain-containing protein [Myxococcaceae bacterium]|nr:DUF3131 domain-containing protein [Myxococcaceae bacterium]
MNFLKGLLAARSHIAFLLGLALALAVVHQVQRYAHAAAPAPGAVPPSSAATAKAENTERTEALAERLNVSADELPLRPTGQALTAEERAFAEAAWAYFERNHQPSTGLVNSNDKFPSTTLWDLGSYAMGLLSAEVLGLVTPKDATERLSKLLDTLAKLPLVDGRLPNKAYQTVTLEMVDYNNNPVKDGLGWSAIDIARLGVPLNVILWRHPELTPKVKALFTAWKLDEAAVRGELQGANRGKDGALVYTQEGRLGYEQYAAKSLLLLGLDVSGSLDPRRHLAIQKVSDQPLAYDARMPARHGGTHNAVLSEPYLLEGLEFGFDQNSLAMARALLKAQMNRAKELGKPVAVSEDNLDRAPYFVYNSALNGGVAWAAFTPDGADASAHRSLSTKAALGWAYLFDGPYSERLRTAAVETVEPKLGWYSGRYDADGALNKSLTANTNGIVLEVLAYKVQGPWLRAAHQPR